MEMHGIASTVAPGITFSSSFACQVLIWTTSRSLNCLQSLHKKIWRCVLVSIKAWVVSDVILWGTLVCMLSSARSLCLGPHRWIWKWLNAMLMQNQQILENRLLRYLSKDKIIFVTAVYPCIHQLFMNSRAVVGDSKLLCSTFLLLSSYHTWQICFGCRCSVVIMLSCRCYVSMYLFVSCCCIFCSCLCCSE